VVEPKPVYLMQSLTNEHALFAYGFHSGAEMTLYNDLGFKITPQMIQASSSYYHFSVEESGSYTVTQSVQGIESEASEAIYIEVIESKEPDESDDPGTDPGTDPGHDLGPTPSPGLGDAPGSDPDFDSGTETTMPAPPSTEEKEEEGVIINLTPVTSDQLSLPEQGIQWLGWAAHIERLEDENEDIKAIQAIWPQAFVLRIELDEALSASDREKVGLYYFDNNVQEWLYVPSMYSEDEQELHFFYQKVGTYALMESERSFEDIHIPWAQQYIEIMAGRQIINGRTEQSFVPSASITRAEFAALLLRALQLPEAEDELLPFEDVSMHAWYARELTTAWRFGLMSGVSATQMAPHGEITREEMAVMMYRAYQIMDGQFEPSDILSKYEDQAEISGWAIEGMDFAVSFGFIQGRTEQQLAPGGIATRAEAAVMLNRFTDFFWREILLENQ